MLTKFEVEEIARNYLLKNDYPILAVGKVRFPEDRDDPEAIEHFRKNNIASVSFESKYFNDPNEEHPCDPGIYIVYVNIATGEVHMPRHM
jgi:hypothetical protein